MRPSYSHTSVDTVTGVSARLCVWVQVSRSSSVVTLYGR